MTTRRNFAVLAGIVILATAGVLTYLNIGKGTTEPTPVPPQPEIITKYIERFCPLVTSETTLTNGWKRYYNDTFCFSIDVPKDWAISFDKQTGSFIASGKGSLPKLFIELKDTEGFDISELIGGSKTEILDTFQEYQALKALGHEIRPGFLDLGTKDSYLVTSGVAIAPTARGIYVFQYDGRERNSTDIELLNRVLQTFHSQ